MNPITIGKATIYNCDCMELLKATPEQIAKSKARIAEIKLMLAKG